MPTRMNIQSFLTDTSPASLLKGGRNGGGVESVGTGLVARNKKEAEVIAASALASLVTDAVNPYCYLYYQQPLRQQWQQSPPKQQSPKTFELPQRLTKNGRKRAIPFPLKLMQVLSDERYSHIVSWMPNGRSFVIIRPKAFVNEILPKHFKSAQYASFTRKLMRWGFSKCEDGTGEFFHPRFRKGRLDLAERMTCQGGSSPSNEETSKALQAKNKKKESKTAEDDATSSSSDEDHSVASSETLEEAKNSSEQEGNRKAAKVRMVPSRDAATTHMLLNKEEYYINMELEQMRLRRCIRAAALSRQALAEMQRRESLAPTTTATTSMQGTRAFAFAAGGFPKLPMSGANNSLLHPWRTMMLSPTAVTNRLFPPFNPSSESRSPSLPVVVGHPNIRGAKTA